MPPLRSIPAAKPVKTERTHEENQERAYIAASRRSDRSLEARVESARRASEIHKRRTGRSLRVTEQDVINEEMYEEEDDDLPMQYRRLTAHLQTSNADFDRRLAAYLTNHVAMRAALGQTMGDQYNNQQYSNAPQFANQLGQFPQSFPNPMLLPQMANMANRSPQSFRASPYPQQAFRQNMHGRSASIATPQELQHMNNYPPVQSPNAAFIKPEDRRMSLPVQTQQNASASPPQLTSASRNSSSTSLTNLKHEAAKQGNGQTSPTGQTSPAAYSASHNHVSPAFDPSLMNMMPFSTSLPHESQQLLGPGFDQNDAFSQMLMGGYGQQQSQPFYTYNPNPSKFKGGSPCFDGINQTLAPGMLDTNMDKYSTPMSGVDSAFTPSTTFGFDNFDPLKGFSHNNVSGMTTPGENDWSSMLDSNVWEEQGSVAN